MTTEQVWISSSPPTLDLPTSKFVHASLLSAEAPSSPSGSLSPDVRTNTPPLFGVQPLLTPGNSWLIVGNYLLTERLADMPSGIAVYRATEISTGQTCICRAMAVERCRTVLLPYTLVSPHQNIDGVKEVVMGSSCAYAVHSTLSAGSEDLHAYVRRRRRLPEKEAARLFAQILDAVCHCHRHGVVIRDIKLRRFLFADDEKTWLKLDGLYDVAMFNGSDDRLTDKQGCLAYVSPEIIDATFSTGPSSSASPPSSTQSDGSYSGCAADMWSLGVMLYTMLVGRYPFADPDACALFTRIRRGRYPTPVDVPLSPLARCLIRSLLTVNPGDRLSAEEAMKHPWLASVEMEQPSAVSPTASPLHDDSIVPQITMETNDEFETN